MNRLRQWLQSFRRNLIAWLLNAAFGLLVKVAVEELSKLPWKAWGVQVNGLADSKVGKEKADPVQKALASGLRLFAEGVEA